MLFMNWLVLELLVIFFILTAVLFLILALSKFHREKKDTTVIAILLVSFVLAEVYTVIHLFFCYQWGLPASVSQNNLTLSSSDWLGFLSGYLGFSGSLVMAYLVYRQSKVINKLSISEYLPSATLAILKSVKSTDFSDTENVRYVSSNILQCPPGEPNRKYYTYHCDLVSSNNVSGEQYEVMLFAEVINNSKSAMRNLSFHSIEIKEIQDKNNVFIFKNRGGNWDPTDKVTDLLPESRIARCFLIDKIPVSFGISWMTIKFTYGGNCPLNMRVLISKTSDSGLTFINETYNSGGECFAYLATEKEE